MKSAKPFIIWTLQRTGGTNLARQLFDLSGLLDDARHRVSQRGENGKWLGKIVDQWGLHEPFNDGDHRPFESVTQSWEAHRNQASLKKEVAEILQLNLPLKHCVEMVPWEVSKALLDAACDQGYCHIFLYRENALDRLLSLQFAKVTGVWGSQMKGGTDFEGKAQAFSLPVDELLTHEGFCEERMTSAWTECGINGVSPYPIAFEALYEASEPEKAYACGRTLLAFLGLSKGASSDKAFIDGLRKHGDQGTRREYQSFQGVQELEKKLMHHSGYAPRTIPGNLQCEALQPMPSDLIHVALDLYPEDLRAFQMFDIGGVVVRADASPSGGLYLEGKGWSRLIYWGIPSHAIGRQFPHNAQAATSRFKASNLVFGTGERFRIIYRDAQDVAHPLFEFRIDPKHSPLQAANK